MSLFTDGYAPREISSGASLFDDMSSPTIGIACRIVATETSHPAEVANAIEAAITAFKDSIEGAFPGYTVSTGGVVVSGLKVLP
ncbi:hypothetical protein [Streptomyces cadmiisoli]|uniref:hypothetical protein n=1 Tax=Streptomyces cadmiisoli TaxID=2184053 RepID=UPI003D733C28